MVKDARVDIVLQRIEENIGEELDLIPSHIRRYGVNNIFTRVFGYLFGWKSDGKPVKLGATEAGSLKVATTGAGLEAYERNPTTNMDGWIAIAGVAVKTETFSNVMSVIDVLTKGFELYAEFSVDGVTWGAKKLFRGDLNHSKSMDLTCKAVRFSNV
ncbi:unnamed protein product, partial [marine sediment metagenome]